VKVTAESLQLLSDGSDIDVAESLFPETAALEEFFEFFLNCIVPGLGDLVEANPLLMDPPPAECSSHEQLWPKREKAGNSKIARCSRKNNQ
jgi:hypothetical protein